MTIRELKEVIKDQPDDMEVLSGTGYLISGSCEILDGASVKYRKDGWEDDTPFEIPVFVLGGEDKRSSSYEVSEEPGLPED